MKALNPSLSTRKLYSKVPRSVRRFYRMAEKEERNRCIVKFRNRVTQLDKTLNNPRSSESRKRMARAEMVILQDALAKVRARS